MELIKLYGISKHYIMGDNVVRAIDNIDLEIKKGEFVAIMGPSGSGKSTSMNLVGNLDLPTYGKIFLEGHDTSHLFESEIAQLRGEKIGFIFQNFNLLGNLTALENVALPMIFQGVGKAERTNRALVLLEKVGLKDRAYHYPGQLSGGQQQRVAIARALANNPEIILADEPTGNLDTQTGEKVMLFLDELNKKGKTIIIITHDSYIAEKHARKIFEMKDGRIAKVREKIRGKWKKE